MPKLSLRKCSCLIPANLLAVGFVERMAAHFLGLSRFKLEDMPAQIVAYCKDGGINAGMTDPWGVERPPAVEHDTPDDTTNGYAG
ncbi:MAG: hypothetical protein H5T92_10830 [Synergistales bacterium]|nr:hypothetical protein [Synergistales bacterium]